MMVKLGTLTTLVELEREMDQAGRNAEREALREAVRALGSSRSDVLTPSEAAGRLGVSIPTVKRWIERRTLDAGRVEGRWLIASASVERLVDVREALRAIELEGLPTDQELQALLGRGPSRASTARDAQP